jgi:hypothetical protein
MAEKSVASGVAMPYGISDALSSGMVMTSIKPQN